MLLFGIAFGRDFVAADAPGVITAFAFLGLGSAQMAFGRGPGVNLTVGLVAGAMFSGYTVVAIKTMLRTARG